MPEKVIVDFVKTHSIIERWIESCKHVEQLLILMEVVDNFITKERFPDETREAINTASISLHISIDLKFREIKDTI